MVRAGRRDDQIVLIRQGGRAGPLPGACTCKARGMAGQKPDPPAGISIGAFNAAPVAANRPRDRRGRPNQAPKAPACRPISPCPKAGPARPQCPASPKSPRPLPPSLPSPEALPRPRPGPRAASGPASFKPRPDLGPPGPAQPQAKLCFAEGRPLARGPTSAPGLARAGPCPTLCSPRPVKARPRAGMPARGGKWGPEARGDGGWGMRGSPPRAASQGRSIANRSGRIRGAAPMYWGAAPTCAPSATAACHGQRGS